MNNKNNRIKFLNSLKTLLLDKERVLLPHQALKTILQLLRTPPSQDNLETVLCQPLTDNSLMLIKELKRKAKKMAIAPSTWPLKTFKKKKKKKAL